MTPQLHDNLLRLLSLICRVAPIFQFPGIRKPLLEDRVKDVLESKRSMASLTLMSCVVTGHLLRARDSWWYVIQSSDEAQ
jgi:hypothetical protein